MNMVDQNQPAAVSEEAIVSPQSVFRAAVWLTGAKIVAYGIGFISTIVLARILVPADFGIIALAMAVVSVSSAVLELPVTLALIQMDDPTDEDFNTAWTLSILRAIAISIFLLVIAHPVARFFHMPHVGNVIMVLAIQPLIFGLRNSHFERYARDLKFSWDITSELLAKSAQFMACVAIALIWKSYWAFVAGVLISAIVGLVVTYVAYPQFPKFSLSSTRKLFGFSAWLGLGAMFNQLNAQTSRFVVASAFGQTSLGQFDIGSRLSTEFSQFLLIPITRSLFSAFSRIVNDAERFRAAYLRSQSTTSAIVMPVGIGLGLMADLLIPLLLGDKWSPAILIVQVYAPTMALTVMAAPIRSVGMALNRTKDLMHRDIVSFLVRVTGMVGGAYFFGFAGFLAAYCLTAIVIVFINLGFLSKFVDVSILQQLRNVSRSLISAACMAIIVMQAKHLVGPLHSPWLTGLEIGVLSALGAISYATCHYFLWHMNGRPDGPEEMGLRVARSLSRRQA
ncbi:MAG: hypothetical protein VR75_08655 [Hyphomonadaceae bacterium BRH_c29]|nr:MAG: hypothetical protein VR75_08655 [Hyphomonadaceae bacterium BRH_c29]